MRWQQLSRARRGPGARIVSFVLRILTGYGLRPYRVFAGLILLAAVAWGVLLHAGWEGAAAVPIPIGSEWTRQAAGSYLPADCAADQPCYSSILFAIETVVPLIDLGQRAYWTLQAGYPIHHLWLNLLTIIGWIASTIAVASLASVDRRHR